MIKETFTPKNSLEWRSWLMKNGESRDAIWLILYKKKSEISTISWSEAVDQALCFGWIDGVKNGIDNDKYKQYFSKRRRKSTWSKINKEKVDILTKNNLMTQSGLKSIDIAKGNGSWSFLDDIDNLIIPADLDKALNQYPTAKDFFNNLSNSNQKYLLYWVKSAKRADTRFNRINKIAISARNKKMP